MSPEIAGIIGVIILIFLMFARMNIGLCMAAVGFVGYAYIAGMKGSLAMIATTPYSTLAQYSLTALPLFVFMGSIVSDTGMGAGLYNSAHKWLGQLKGGLAIATIGACGLFAAICGSSTAEAVTIGKIALPEMKRFQYDDALATGSVASGGTLGILIPPSMGFLIYGIITEQSVGTLFMAGILPGVLLTVLFILVIMFMVRRNPKLGPGGPKTTFKEKVISLKGIWATVVLFILVLGGLYFGFFTPTEGGAVGAFGAIVITLISRQLNMKNLTHAIVDAGTTTAMMLILMLGAFIFMKFLTITKLPFAMASAVGGLGFSPYVILLIIVIVYLILGMFLDVISAIVLTVPLIYPVVIAIGFDPIWFGVVMVILMQMGLITPPVGMEVFVLSSVTNVPMSTIFKGVWPFVGAMLACILILAIWPEIALFIPHHM
jgi:C4-dicarboxylate transporter, DctM subunit